MSHDPAAFRRRLSSGDKLSGTFVNAPSSHAKQIFGDLGCAFVVIDEEHALVDPRRERRHCRGGRDRRSCIGRSDLAAAMAAASPSAPRMS
jgi:hypothetical protein